MPEQTLPATEPGHAPPVQKLPRVDGTGVKDKVEPSEYPKMIPHPIHGHVMALNAENEAEWKEIIAALPPVPGPSPAEMEIIHLQNLLVRELTADEKAFVKEIDAAVALLEDEDSPGLIEFGGLKIPPEPEEEPDEVIYVSPPLTPLPDGNTANVTVETKDYTDGSSATGVAPLPDHSPEGAPEVPKSDAESASQPSAAENPPSE